jgi:NAD(P)-dependent dehydrogenase (short-subunit alcohol dehydrogenase family)
MIRTLFVERSMSLFEPHIATTPLRRLGTTDEVAEAALFLASDRASFITGEILNLSGGYVLGQ